MKDKPKQKLSEVSLHLISIKRSPIYYAVGAGVLGLCNALISYMVGAKYIATGVLQGVVPGLLAGGFLAWLLLRRQFRNQSAKLLAQIDNGNFADLTILAEYGAKPEAKLALQKVQTLLPTLTEEEFADLNRGRRNWLGKQLAGKDREFALALLPVFAEYGERSELKWVLSLADGKYLASNDLELKGKAIETTDAITQRIGAGELKKKLLRGSTIPPVPETLLRPVAENVTEETQLLRSSQSGEEE